jgi:N-acetyl-anhydromuramyl-L-alanine amidase AmpD
MPFPFMTPNLEERIDNIMHMYQIISSRHVSDFNETHDLKVSNHVLMPNNGSIIYISTCPQKLGKNQVLQILTQEDQRPL